MTVELQNGVVIKINDENTEGTITESPNARGDIFIPRSVDNKGKKVPITIMSNRSFVDNENIHSITFADDSDLQIIRKGAFSHSSLEKLSIPANVTTIENGFCQGAKKLVHIEVSSNSKHYISINNELLIAQVENSHNVLIWARRNIENATIPEIVQKIGPYSFDHCQNLKTVSFASSKVDEICNFAFNECSNLTDIQIPSSVLILSERCFNACKQLKTITIPKDSKLRKIAKLAFFHTSIEKLSIPSSTEELVEGFCSGTPSLNAIEVSPDNKKYSSFNGDYLTTKGENNGTELLFVRRNIETFLIPSTIRKIGVYAFQTCHKLKTVTFSYTKSETFIDSIDDHSFSECLSLERIEIPSNIIKRIGKFAFSSCKNLKSVTFVSKSSTFSVLELIDDNAFSGCESLTEIAIPESVRRIGSSCFHTCSNLKSVTFLNSKLENIGNYAFSYCSSLAEITVPSSIKSIGEFCFESCSSLHNFTFKGEEKIELKSIAKFSFSYCSSLESSSMYKS